MVLVEEASPVSFVQFLDLIRAEWPPEWGCPSDGEMLAEMDKSFDPGTDVVKRLVDKGRIIGWYRYSKWPREGGDGRSAHTLDIAVLPEFQGQGLGKTLMDDLIADCRARGYAKLMSRTFENNLQSIGLHKATGFSEAFRKDSSIVWELTL
jgi:L-amino acid N-acyltransferase YncA